MPRHSDKDTLDADIIRSTSVLDTLDSNAHYAAMIRMIDRATKRHYATHCRFAPREPFSPIQAPKDVTPSPGEPWPKWTVAKYSRCPRIDNGIVLWDDLTGDHGPSIDSDLSVIPLSHYTGIASARQSLRQAIRYVDRRGSAPLPSTRDTPIRAVRRLYVEGQMHPGSNGWNYQL